MGGDVKPIVLITGASGQVGTALAAALAADYRVVGMDREGGTDALARVPIDLASDAVVDVDGTRRVLRARRQDDL